MAVPDLQGNRFQFQENKTEDKAQLYIYRIISPPTQRSPELIINGKNHFDLKSGGFIRISIPPGETTIETIWIGFIEVEDKSLILSAESGKTYFIKCHSEIFDSSIFSALKRVPKEIALRELEGLKEIEEK